MSSSVPCAPSNLIDRPAARARERKSDTSVTHGAILVHAARNASITCRQSIVESAMRRLRASTLWRSASVRVHGMPGVVTALIARHDRKVRGQQVDDLAFAFVAPLRAQDGYVHTLRARSILPSTR